MDISLVMTVIGPDRSGLVATLSDAVAEHGGNWLESRLSHLGGQFAGVIRVSCSPDVADGLQAQLQESVGGDLKIEIACSDQTSSDESGQSVHIELIANDRPGIVRQLTQAISGIGGNIEELITGLESAAMAGHPVFKAEGKIRVPTGVEYEDIQIAIEALSPDLQVSCSAIK